MAIRSFSLSSIMGEEFSGNDWPAKARKEAVQFIVSAEPWIPFFSNAHGPLTLLKSRDGADDPPDVEAVFEKRSLGFEMTSLMPQRLGRYDGALSREQLMRKVNMLNLSSDVGPSNEDMMTFALSEGPEKWADPDLELELWCKEAAIQFDKKFRASGSDYVIMHASPRHIAGFLLPPLVSFLNARLQARETACPGIIASNTCFGHNKSWLLEKNQPLQSKVTNKTYSRMWVETLKPSDQVQSSP
jgi:hypothetical protein